MNYKKIPNSVLIKPAGPDCNLACEYCFYLKKYDLFGEQKVHRMSDEILRETVRQIMQQGGQQVSFGWQGGEPTLMGRQFFENAVTYQNKFGKPQQIVGNGLQTNGILIDQDWAKFLKEANFLVGLSLDGPEHIHNKYRKFRSGKGSWEQVIKARDRLLNVGTEINSLVVINDYSVQFPKEIYDFHKKSGINFMQFIPCVEIDPKYPDRAAHFSVSAEGYGQFLCDVFDLWQNDFRFGQPTTSVRFFDSVFYTYVGMQAPECTLLEECGIYVVVEHNGNVYSCDFYVEPQWRLGNVMQDKIIELLNSPKQNEFGTIKSKLPPECTVCKWLNHCWGGCPKDRQHDPRDRGSNHFCQSFKMFFEHADTRLKKMAEQWMREQGQHQQLEKQYQHMEKDIGRNDPCPCGSGKKFKKCCGKI